MTHSANTAVTWAEQSPEHAKQMLQACDSAIAKLRRQREKVDDQLVANMTNANAVRSLCHEKGWPIQ